MSSSSSGARFPYEAGIPCASDVTIRRIVFVFFFHFVLTSIITESSTGHVYRPTWP